MTTHSAWRTGHPGTWLVVALAADLATYGSAADRSAPVLPWLLLDVWLAHRVWRGGRTALAWYRGLQAFGATVFGLVVVGGLTGDGGAPHSATFLLFAVSTWCLLAPALTRHVAAPSHAVDPVGLPAGPGLR